MNCARLHSFSLARLHAWALCAAILFSAGGAAALPKIEHGHGGKGPGRMEKKHGALRKGVFVVAERSLKDPNFAKTVVLLTHYGPSGTVGVIINRPTKTTLSEALPNVKELRDSSQRLYFGGPVLQNAMVLLLRSSGKLTESYHVFGDVYFSGSVNALAQALSGAAADSVARVYHGYTGWAPGQLEFEIGRGDWRVAEADAVSIFEKDPANVWEDLIEPAKQFWIMRDYMELALPPF